MTGRDRRLKFEYDTLMRRFEGRDDISISTRSFNNVGMPVEYMVKYQIRSICSVENMDLLGSSGATNPPVFADCFFMGIDIPDGYPCIDSQPAYRFLTRSDDGNPIPHPWHPNIRWFGDFAGRVCMNTPDTYTEIAWCVERVSRYLKYEIYHALNEPPYPEDQQVASWVIRQGEPEGWIFFNKSVYE